MGSLQYMKPISMQQDLIMTKLRQSVDNNVITLVILLYLACDQNENFGFIWNKIK